MTNNETYVCSKCETNYPRTEEFFYKRGGKRKGLAGTCRSCSSKTGTETVLANKKKCLEYKGNECQKCGYKKSYYSLTFHHREEKNFTISDKLKCSWKILKPELDKCDLLCSNCHGEEHERLENRN